MPSDNRPRGKAHYRFKHGGKGTRIYNIWCKMISRCENSSDEAYPRYGGSGITICQEWRESFEAFRAWALANGYERHLTIDRYPDQHGGYAPSNCRWATYAQQNRNYSRNRPVTYHGREVLVCDLAAEVGFPQDIIKNRIFRYGWDIERAVTTPVQHRVKSEPWKKVGMSRSAWYRAGRPTA